MSESSLLTTLFFACGASACRRPQTLLTGPLSTLETALRKNQVVVPGSPFDVRQRQYSCPGIGAPPSPRAPNGERRVALQPSTAEHGCTHRVFAPVVHAMVVDTLSALSAHWRRASWTSRVDVGSRCCLIRQKALKSARPVQTRQTRAATSLFTPNSLEVIRCVFDLSLYTDIFLEFRIQFCLVTVIYSVAGSSSPTVQEHTRLTESSYGVMVPSLVPVA